jgi:hypothetical protein
VIPERQRPARCWSLRLRGFANVRERPRWRPDPARILIGDFSRLPPIGCKQMDFFIDRLQTNGSLFRIPRYQIHNRGLGIEAPSKIVFAPLIETLTTSETTRAFNLVVFASATIDPYVCRTTESSVLDIHQVYPWSIPCQMVYVTQISVRNV